MCTLLDLVCMDSSYEMIQDRGMGKKLKSFYNDLKRICGPLEVCSQVRKLKIFTLKDIACTDASYETM